MDRTRFFAKNVIDTVPELDFLDNTLTGFNPTRATLYYRVTQADLLAPDNIAFKVYQNERFWWILCLANDINNVCEELYEGQMLKIPDILDIYDFWKSSRKR